MRFVLDSDVDEGGCRRALVGHGHEVLTARAGGVQDEDPDVTAYALTNGAAVITHDRRYTIAHRKNPIGRHVWLRCPDPAAEAVLNRALPQLAPLVEAHELVTIKVSAVEIRVWFPNGGTQVVELD